jgi:hypothetical protein
MGSRIGIVAGSGAFPALALSEAQKRGYSCFVAGIVGEAEASLKENAEEFEWVGVGEILKLVTFFKKNQVHEVLLAGKVSSQALYQEENLDATSFELLLQIKDKSPAVLLKSVIVFLAQQGIKVLDPTIFLTPYFCPEGILTEKEPPLKVLEDVVYGWEIARAIADLDIGQTVVVKNKAVIAVEGIEGTDEAIQRAGTLAGKGVVVIKVSRTSQDPRIDLPAVGLGTVKALVQAGGAALCIEAGKVLFFQKEEAISLANASGLALIARKA